MALTDKLTAIANAIRTQSGKTAKLTLDQMPSEIIDLQSLAFQIVKGTSAPSNPKGNTIWINTSTAITSWDFSATKPYLRSRKKNLITYPFFHTTNTVNGVTYTDNKNGKVTANGTATTNAIFRLSGTTGEMAERKLIFLEKGTYTLSGCPSGGGSSSYFIELYKDLDADDVRLARDYGSGATFTVDEDCIVRLAIVLISGFKASGVVFAPQLEKGSTATSFVKGDALGQVWISTGVSAPTEFNALKKNGIHVCPLKVKQYVDSAWVYKEAKIYQNGEWKSFWDGLLYNAGNQYEDFTGGWKKVVNGGTATIGSTTLFVSASASGQEACIQTENVISLSGFDTLCVNVTDWYSGDNSSNRCQIRILDSGGNVKSQTAVNAEKVYKVDVSSIDSGYVQLRAFGAEAVTHNMTVDKIWLE